jgi:hypothetical protein
MSEGKSEAQQFYENFTVASDSGASASSQSSDTQSHIYDYLHAREQYGSNRYLRVPDGRYERAHYTYQRQTPRHSLSARHWGQRTFHNSAPRPVSSWSSDVPYAKGTDDRRNFWGGLREWFERLMAL